MARYWRMGLIFILVLSVVMIGVPRGTATANYLGGIPEIEEELFFPLSTNADNIEFVGQVGGSAISLALRGNYAYVAQGPRLTIVKIDNPANPTVVGRSPMLPGVINSLVVAGNFAYVTNLEDGLFIFDISNISSPRIIGSYNTPGWANDVAIAGGYAYVADHGSGLSIIDVSDPTNPTQTGFFDTQGTAYAVDTAGDYIYVADFADGLRIINITNPNAPFEVGHFNTPSYSRDVAVAGGNAYVADWYGGLRIINISDPANPVEVGSYANYGLEAVKVAVAGNFAYVTGDWNVAGEYFRGMHVIRVENPASPTEVALYDRLEGWADVIAVDEKLYVADAFGLRIINVSNPRLPTEVGHYSMPVAEKVAVDGNNAHVIDRAYGLRIFNIANPATPLEIGAHDTLDAANDIFLLANLAYVVTDEGLHIINFTNPTLPTEVGFYDTPGWGQGVAVSGHYAYVADGSPGGLRVINILNPAAPIEVGYLDTPGDARNVTVAGDYAYVADGYDGGLRIINIADPSNPILAGFYDASGWPWDVSVVGNYAYVADYFDGIRIIDITNPANLNELGLYNEPTSPVGVTVADGFAYVADSSGLHIVDISNPNDPNGAGNYETPGDVSHIAVEGDLVYVADGSGGLLILRFTGTVPTYSVSGQVFDQTASPIADVAVCTQNTVCASTDSSGAYSINNLAAGSYSLTASKTGYSFAPSTNVVNVPPDATAINFTGTNLDLQLAMDYAPYVRMHMDDKMIPMSVDLALEHAICLKREPSLLNLTPDCKTTEVTLEMLEESWKDETDAYIDFEGDPNDDGDGGSQVHFETNIMSAAGNNPVVYAYVTPDNRPDGHRAIQFWIYYYYNNWWNKHEGDWEMVQIELDASEQPIQVAYSQHDSGSRRAWSNVQHPGGHPIVYPGQGSHASYFYPGEYSHYGKKDVTANESSNREWNPSPQLVSQSSTPWVDFRGHWGEWDFRPGYSGPPSPARQVLKWVDPLQWMAAMPFDDQAEHNLGKLIVRALPDCQVGIENTENSLKWGWFDGSYYDEINGVETITNPLLQLSTTIFHQELGEFQQKYRITWEGCTSLQAAGALTAGTTDSVQIGSVQYYDDQTGDVVTLTYNLPQDWNPSTSTAEVMLSPSVAPNLDVDLDGDENVDNSTPPISREEQPLIPAPQADFAAAPLTGPAPLTVTFGDASTGFPDFWQWNFGDGQTSEEQHPEHTYDLPGTYEVTLTVTNSTGNDAETKTAYITVMQPTVSSIYLSPTGTGKVGSGAAARSFTGADIISYVKDTNTWDILYDGSYVKTPKNIDAFAFDGDDILISFAAGQAVVGQGTFAGQDIARFTPTSLGYLNTAGAFAWVFDGSDVGLTTSGENIDALWLDGDGRLYISATGSGEVPVDSAVPAGAKFKFQDEDVLRFTPTALGATTSGRWELYWDTTAISGMGVEDIGGYWEDPATGDRYASIVGAFNVGNVAYGGKYAGNGKTILRFAPNAAAPGGWAPAEKVTWLAAGATFPSNLDGIEMGR